MASRKPDIRSPGGMPVPSSAASTSTDFRQGILCRRGGWFYSNSLRSRTQNLRGEERMGSSLFGFALPPEGGNLVGFSAQGSLLQKNLDKFASICYH